MNRIFLTGDTHGELEIVRLSTDDFPGSKNLDRGDVAIVLGDFGLLWNNPPKKSEGYWLKWLSEKPFTTLFIRGNHDNHELLDALPEQKMFGGVVRTAAENVFLLETGRTYFIAGKRVLVFGGAMSTDRVHRTPGKNWWPGEIPPPDALELALKAGEVDLILAHTCPKSVAAEFVKQHGGSQAKLQDPVCEMLENVCAHVGFRRFYFGHWHEEWEHVDKDGRTFRMMYQDIVEVL